MDLTKLFEMQRVLDERIMEKHPELKGQNNLDWKILALQVELGECANEWRGFKKWSGDRGPRTKCVECKGTGYCHFSGFADHMQPCGECGGYPETKNPLLEEYVDCLHFILSIGLELDKRIMDVDFEVYGFIESAWSTDTTIQQFQTIYNDIASFSSSYDVMHYIELVSQFLGLGDMLGFTWEQIEQAYISKNEVNHERQNTGY